MSEVITIENAELERDAYRHESDLAHLGGRLKFQFCRQCGTNFGMQSVHVDTLEEMMPAEIEALSLWYCDTGDEYLYYPCPRCNPTSIILDWMMKMGNTEAVLKWCANAFVDPMAPDYAALATKWRAWADELEAVSWYDATLARKVAAHWYGPDSHPATLSALRQLQEKYPDNELLAPLAAEEPVLASEDGRESAGLEG